jgi:farnesyl diphosphate synthase
MTAFLKKLNIVVNQTNSYLKKIFSKQKKNSYLLHPMKYGVFSGGKRFRSAIVVNTGKIYGIDYKKLIIISSAIECVHAYSLIHDDLPSMDNDDFRRGKPSVHKKFNEFTAILAGNSLLTLAFEILSSKDLKIYQNQKNDLIKTLSECSGHSGLAGGQYSDLIFENKKVSKNSIINMQKKKTGELFGFCCESIAILKNFKLPKRKKLKQIGINIGLLFQIVDDLVDYKQDSLVTRKLNKNYNSSDKSTFINLVGYDKTLIFAKKLKKKISKEIKKEYGYKSNDLVKSVEFILDRKF